MLVERYPRYPKHPARRSLGGYISKNNAIAKGRDIRFGLLTLAEARDKAREWLDMIGRGLDPKIEEERQKVAARKRMAVTFAAVATEFIDRHEGKLKRISEARRIIEREFVRRWSARPIGDIEPHEVSAAIRAIRQAWRPLSSS